MGSKFIFSSTLLENLSTEHNLIINKFIYWETELYWRDCKPYKDKLNVS